MRLAEVEDLIRQSIAEVERHLWLESEKRGQDLGRDLAALDFLNRHYEAWLKKKLDDCYN